ncbi:hypothetical protein CEP88_02515 [Roseobacter denitrificans]|nr:hypothetical protein [Roseobacter denitrificans]AVL51596.1 hypothetical protein CEP88_02515 [Roseobacter denitrificans]SFF77037.1 protein ImuA [Roseobacter denitrificans OCh 114]
MTISHPLLARRPAYTAPALGFIPDEPEMALVQGRVHEASGPARRSFAMWLAAQTEGPVLWIAPALGQEKLNSDGVCAWINPARLIFVSPKRTEDLLWTMEEVLRSGAVALSIADLPALPSLTQVRRMHLAAETGSKSATGSSSGLLLTPGQGGAAGVETRWHLSPRHAGARECWRLERRRARAAPPKDWTVCKDTNAHKLSIKRS